MNESAFLVCDIANSVLIKKLMEGDDIAHRDYRFYHGILKPHFCLVQELMTEYDGQVVKFTGDGAFLVFPSTLQAAEYAVCLQLAHQKSSISTPLGRLKIRVGIHRGFCFSMGDDLIGYDVDYTFRIGALATDDQILVSQATAACLHNAELADLTLYNHGLSCLKGIGEVPLIELLYGNKEPLAPRSTPSELIESLQIAAQGLSVIGKCLVEAGLDQEEIAHWKLSFLAGLNIGFVSPSAAL